jgi:hypothetical protein
MDCRQTYSQCKLLNLFWYLQSFLKTVLKKKTQIQWGTLEINDFQYHNCLETCSWCTMHMLFFLADTPLMPMMFSVSEVVLNNSNVNWNYSGQNTTRETKDWVTRTHYKHEGNSEALDELAVIVPLVTVSLSVIWLINWLYTNNGWTVWIPKKKQCYISIQNCILK